MEKTNDRELRDRESDLGALFGDDRARDRLKRVALDHSADPAARNAALQSLIGNRPSDLREICESLLTVEPLAASAVRGLSQFDDPAVGENLARRYREFPVSVRPVVIETLASRPAFAGSMLARMAAGEIAPSDVTPYHARQIRSFNDSALTRQLTEAWGELRDSAADTQKLIARLKQQLTPEVLAQADPRQGRVLFNTVCAACHMLYGTGGTIGPDLTGSGRDNLDYLLDNVADPSAVVNADFRMTVVRLKDGRVLNGFIAARTERTLTLKTMTESMALERSEIASLQESKMSIMPEGLLAAWNETQLRDLMGYLMSKSQVPLPEN
ncbi:c-type cytochrome [bacterium]|nr:c-type cytochrome [bacterium]